MKWGGEGAQEWEGRERQPKVQRAREDGQCASEEEQGQEGKRWAKRNGDSGDWSKGEARKGKKERDREMREEIGLELRARMMVAKGRKAEQKIGSIQDTTASHKSGQKRAHKLLLK